MRNKLIAFVTLSVLLAASLLSAQDVKRTSKLPALTGGFDTAAYGYVREIQGMRIGASLSTDGSTLALAIEAPTTGWVAIGLGSLFMNGAYIVMGADGGNPKVIVQQGQGHHHGDVANKVLASLVKTNGVNTVLQFNIPAAPFVQDGTLKMIIAYGRSTDMRSYHATHASLQLSVQS